MERALRLERRGQRVGRGGECGTERVTDRLENVAAARADRTTQKGVVPRQRRGHRGLLRFP